MDKLKEFIEDELEKCTTCNECQHYYIDLDMIDHLEHLVQTETYFFDDHYLSVEFAGGEPVIDLKELLEHINKY